jgi:hypothetical protein
MKDEGGRMNDEEECDGGESWQRIVLQPAGTIFFILHPSSFILSP